MEALYILIWFVVLMALLLRELGSPRTTVIERREWEPWKTVTYRWALFNRRRLMFKCERCGDKSGMHATTRVPRAVGDGHECIIKHKQLYDRYSYLPSRAWRSAVR